MNTQRTYSNEAAKLRELAQQAAEYGRRLYPAPPVARSVEDGQGLLDRFPWEQQ